MRQLTDPDPTQQEILRHLATTERLLSAVATKLSRADQPAEIIPMPDLGLPHNVRRMHGGFYTGAMYSWCTTEPFIPVDATVNLCGVALFRLDQGFDSATSFAAAVTRARRVWEDQTRYVWNYANGNHFIIHARVHKAGGELPQGDYLALHASPAEFKAQYNGLYPSNGNWYADQIETLEDSRTGRYLRYIRGRAAERFHAIASMMATYQTERHRFCAGLVAGEANVVDEILTVTHYGMPDDSSIGIGCQALAPDAAQYLLLTRPEQPLFLMQAASGGPNVMVTAAGEKRMVTPHGLGVVSGARAAVRYLPSALEVSGRRYHLNDSMATDVQIREFDRERDIQRILDACPGSVLAELDQIHSYYRR